MRHSHLTAALLFSSLLGVACDGGGLDSPVEPDGELSAAPEPGVTPEPSSLPQASHTDAACIDGQYREPFSNQDDDVSALIANYTPGANADDAANALMVAVLENRFPVGSYLVEQGYENGAFDRCSLLFVNDTNSASSVVGGISGAVHECGHAVNLSQSVSAFVIQEDVRFTCDGGAFFDTPRPPPRSLLGEDAYVGLWPSCVDGTFQDCDVYAEIYWDDQAFELLLEELLQYINDAAASAAVRDLPGAGFIERHGAMTMLWWLERYLLIMRTNPDYAGVYTSLMEDPCWQDLVLTIWSRGWAFLDATVADETPADRTVQGFIEDPDLLAEIQRVRDAAGCP